MKAHILMADVVDSSSYPGKQLMSNLKSVVDSVNKKHSKSILSPLTITLGDEFQGIVKDLPATMAIIFALEESLLVTTLNYRLRYIVNYGNVDTPINKDNAHEMLGEGLTRAREELEEMKSSGVEIKTMGLDKEKQKKLNLATVLFKSVYNDWHEKDRKLVADFLENDDYKELAQRYKKDPSSMWRKRRTLKIDDYKASKKLIDLIAHE